MIEFKLTTADKANPLWNALADHMRQQRDKYRRQNDQSQTVEQTEKLRGRIAELTSLLALEEERKPIS